MPTVYLSPIGNSQQVDSSGVPRNLAKLYTYAAGSTTPRTTYTDSTGNTAQANPIILNSLGLPDNPIWLPTGQTKFVLKTPADVTIWTEDNVTGINDVSLSVSEWQASGLTPTYISATSFSFAGDQTPNCLVGRRLQSTNTAGTVYSRITAASFGAGITTVTVASDSGVLDSGLSAVSYGLLTPTNPSYPVFIDSVAKFMDNADTSKLLAFQLSGITTGTTRTLTVPDVSQTIAVAGNAQSLLSSVAGTNTITAALSPVALAAYASGQTFYIIPANTNSGATTINIDSLGAKNVFFDGAACGGGELKAGIPALIQYDGTQFNIISEGYKGRVLQVVFGNTLTSTTTTSSSYADTTLTASITPKFSTSKVLVLVSQYFRATRAADGTVNYFKLVRNSTDLTENGEIGIETAAGGSVALDSVWSASFLDSPASTSSVTYKTQAKVTPTPSSSSLTTQYNSYRSTILLMEIGA